MYSVPFDAAGEFAEITTGPDRALWFTDSNELGRIGRISTGGQIRLFTVPFVAAPYGIALGPDGNVWFTLTGLDNAYAIGRITPLGIITILPVTVPVAEGQIAVGPDRNLWFTDYNGNVDEMTTGGVVTTYAVPSPLPIPYGMARGPDERMWFTEPGTADTEGGSVGAVVVQGAVTQYVPKKAEAYGYPNGITAGPDGNLWFCYAFGAIAKVTPAGVFTIFTTPTTQSFPREIAVGSDGSLWFTESFAHQIGRATTAGVITEYPIPAPTGDFPVGITAGPDGNIWFTDGNLIGKVVLR